MPTSYQVNGLTVYPVKSIGEVLGLTERQLRTARARSALPPAAVAVDDALRFYDEGSLLAWRAGEPIPRVPFLQLVGPKGMAASADVKILTFRSYMHKGLTPPPDFNFGDYPAWLTQTRDEWLAGRPGRSLGPTSRTSEQPPLEEFLTLQGFSDTAGVPHPTVERRWARDELPRPDAQIGLYTPGRRPKPTYGWKESTARLYGLHGITDSQETGRGVARQVFLSVAESAAIGQVSPSRVYYLIHAGRFLRAAAGIGNARGYDEDAVREFFQPVRAAERT